MWQNTTYPLFLEPKHIENYLKQKLFEPIDWNTLYREKKKTKKKNYIANKKKSCF